MRAFVWVMIAAFMAMGTGVHAASSAPAEPWGMRPRDPIDLPAKEFFTSHLWAPMPGLGEAQGLALADCKKAVDFAKAPYKITRAQQRISGPEMIILGPKGEEARVTKISSDTILVEWPAGPRAYGACPRAGSYTAPKPEPVKPKEQPDGREPGETETPAPKEGEREQAPKGQTPGDDETPVQPPTLPREAPPAAAPTEPKPQDMRPPLQPEPYPLPPVIVPPKTQPPAAVPPAPQKPLSGKPATPKQRGNGPVTELPEEEPLDPAAPGANLQAPAPTVSPPPASQPPSQPKPVSPVAPPPDAPAKAPSGPAAPGVPFVL